MIRLSGFVIGSALCALALLWLVEGPMSSRDVVSGDLASTTALSAKETSSPAAQLPPPQPSSNPSDTQRLALPDAAQPVRQAAATRDFGKVFPERPASSPVEAPAEQRAEPRELREAPVAPEVSGATGSEPLTVSTSLEPSVPAALPPVLAAQPSVSTPPVMPVRKAGANAARTAQAASEVAPDVAPTPPAAVPVATEAAVSGSLWAPVWESFRSELSARGFAGRLQTLTGFEYQVVSVPPRRYQVQVAHTDEAERLTRLARIESMTGLRVNALASGPANPPANAPIESLASTPLALPEPLPQSAVETSE